MNKQNVDRIFMFIFGIFGFFLFIICANSFTIMKKECVAPVIYDGLLAMMTIGAVLTTMAVSYMICNVTTSCYDKQIQSLYISDFYLGVSAFLTLVLCILSMVMGTSIKNYPSCTVNQPNLRTNIWFIFGFCLVLLVGSVSIVGYNIYEKDFLIRNK